MPDSNTKGAHTNITFLLIIGIFAIASGFIIVLQSDKAVSEVQMYDIIDRQTLPARTAKTQQASHTTLIEPIAGFAERITKKPFGIYITPETSPVQPERFNGYHTGVDVEYDDTTDDIPVKAIADGIIIASQSVPGYGGVVAIQYEINNESVIGLYGHLDNATRLTAGTEVTGGQTVGFLGEDQSIDTDGERKHLHFGILKGTSVSYKGYVNTEAELNDWYDPLVFYE